MAQGITWQGDIDISLGQAKNARKYVFLEFGNPPQ